VSRLPLSGGNSIRTFNLPGTDTTYNSDIRIGTPEYFRTMGIPLLQGRYFTEHDAKGAAPVAIVNDALVRATFPGQDPIGKYIVNFGPKSEKLEIVGVVGNVRHLALETAPRAEIYQPLGQASWPRMFVAVRTLSANPLTLVPAIQEAVWSVDKNVAPGTARSMEGLVARSLLKRKFTMTLLTIFAGLAVTLAAIGLYGVMSYSVSQRTREIGIRMALGAQRAQVLKLIVNQGMKVTAIGVLLGIIASLGLTRLIANLLFGVSATDFATFFVLSIILLSVALLACWWPARRASGVDPMVALRAE
jgi:putative ABC transport system permease protein